MVNLIDSSQILILIVDDNPVHLRMEQMMLSKKGYRTAVATNAAGCIEAARKLKPDLILLDIVMPEMNGLDACKVLRRDERTKDIPVIFVTGRTDDEVLQEAFESGGTDYVRKPVSAIELLTRISSALSQKILIQKLLEEEKLDGMLEMAGAVCHELNQPLQVISGYSTLLMMDMAENHELYGYVTEIREQVERMAAITKKLMGITRYEACHYVGKTRIVDIDRASGRL